MKVPKFEYTCPATLDEAVSLLATHEIAKPIAFRLAALSVLVDLPRVPGLYEIGIAAQGEHLGARSDGATSRLTAGSAELWARPGKIAW